MTVLAVNCGSSSLKFRLSETPRGAAETRVVRANALREHAKKHARAILAEQFKSPVVLLLCAALLAGEAVRRLAPAGRSSTDDGREP